MPEIGNIYQSNDWLKANNDGTLSHDDASREVEATIVETGIHEFDDGKKQVWLRFDEITPRLGLGQMNADECIDFFRSTNTDDWIGGRVRISTMRMPSGGFKGKTHMVAIRGLSRPGSEPTPDESATAGDPPPERIETLTEEQATRIKQRLEAAGCTVGQLREQASQLGATQIGGGLPVWPKSQAKIYLQAIEQLEQAPAGIPDSEIPF